ncbi:hypothetical protein ACLKA6_016145 [Drosophila palustris]
MILNGHDYGLLRNLNMVSDDTAIDRPDVMQLARRLAKVKIAETHEDNARRHTLHNWLSNKEPNAHATIPTTILAVKRVLRINGERPRHSSDYVTSEDPLPNTEGRQPGPQEEWRSSLQLAPNLQGFANNKTKKEELMQYGSEFKIVLTGTVDTMRKEFGEWVEGNEGRAPHAERLDALSRKHGRSSPFKDPITITRNEDKEMDRNTIAAALEKLDFASTSGEAQHRSEQQKQEELRSPWGRSSTMQHNRTNTEYRTPTERNPVRDYAAVAKQVREWSFKFDGNSKPLEFLEQVECDARAAKRHSSEVVHRQQRALEDLDIVRNQLPGVFPTTGLLSKLLEEVTRRKQGVDEPFKRYMVEMQTVMRPLRLFKERERQQINSCSPPDFRAFARPYQNGSLIELMQLAEEFEELESDREKLRQHTRQNRSRLMVMEDSRPRENNASCTRCAEHARTQPQPTPRAFSGGHSRGHRRAGDVGVRVTGRGNAKTRA